MQCERSGAAALWGTGSVVVLPGLGAPRQEDLPGPGIEPVSPALAGGLLASEPQRKAFSGLLAKNAQL